MDAPFTWEATGLEKNYPGGFHLQPFNLTLQPGDCLAVLGPNGAGKSTLFQMMSGSLDSSGGSIRFLGQRLSCAAWQLKRRIGYLPQQLHLPEWMSGREVLSYASQLHAIKDESAIKKQLEIWDAIGYQHRPLASCSHGMQKRIGLALATLQDPDLLILDEPFSGLDLFHTRTLKKLLKSRRESGKLSVVSSHIAPYIAELSSRVLILEKGSTYELHDWLPLSLLERIQQIEEQFSQVS